MDVKCAPVMPKQVSWTSRRGNRLESRAYAIAQVCEALSVGDCERAVDTLTQSYPFLGTKNTPRRYGPGEATRIFVRDGFVDRYSGARVVFPPVLRAISVMLPEAFPFHPNWKMEVTHPAYWELTATIDHIEATSRGGADDESNWVTTSMARNSAKGNHSLEDLGWSLHPAGKMGDWDGLLHWYIAITESNPELIVDAAMKRWRQAAIEVLTHGGIDQDTRR